MHWKKILGICSAGLLSLPGAVSAGEKLVFVPLDNRPVSLAYTADSFRKAGYQVVTPPAELLASDRVHRDRGFGRYPDLWGPYRVQDP